MATLIADRRLYLTRDKARVVEEGDPAAGWLLAGKGGVIEEDAVARYKLHFRDGKVVVPKAEPEPEPAPEPAPELEPEPESEEEPEEKQAEPLADKMSAKLPNKSRGKGKR